MKEIFSVNSQHANSTVVKKKKSMSWAELKEAGTEVGQGRGKIVSVD